MSGLCSVSDVVRPNFSQTPVSRFPTGRVLTQSSPVMPPRTIALSEPHNTSIQSVPGKKIAISPLKTPSKVSFTRCFSPFLGGGGFFFLFVCFCFFFLSFFPRDSGAV